jgi:hypothetical protein
MACRGRRTAIRHKRKDFPARGAQRIPSFSGLLACGRLCLMSARARTQRQPADAENWDRQPADAGSAAG